MELAIPSTTNALASSTFLSRTQPSFLLLRPLLSFPNHERRHRRRTAVRASGTGDGSENFSWPNLSRSVRRGSECFLSNFAGYLRRETGFDLDSASRKAGELIGGARDVANKGRAAVDWFRLELVPRFVQWNKLEHWKDLEKWEPKRMGALIMYIIIIIISCQRMHVAFTTHLDRRSRKELTEAYMEALIPEPSPANVRRFKKSMWRKIIPKGLKIKKFIQGPRGTLIQDSSYAGEDAWDDEPEPSQDIYTNIIENDTRLSLEEKKDLKEKLDNSGLANMSIEGQESGKSWRERLGIWNEIMRKDKMKEQIDSINAKYVVDFDMQEVEKSLRKEVVEKVSNTQGSRALWISKRWWHYRPKLPYTYFLKKLDCSEVAAVVFTEDLKKIYVTMKEGFPLEYTVYIPLDPYLFEIISSSGAEVDLLQKQYIHYFLKVVAVLAPGLLILWLIRESVMLVHITSRRYLYKKYNQLFDMAYAENFILPVESSNDTRSMYKEVILGGDVWDLLDEIMIYMNSPMQYYEKEVKFIRGVLLSGPPGTGKTLFARTLAKESGMPFVFASGAEFTDGEKSGAVRINEIFTIARRNIDAIAGRHARKDPRRQSTFETLIAQLDGEQAVIFICATNRPDELDPEFVLPGRIDRRLFIGLPDAKQRVQIFAVHSAGKKFAEDTDFEKVVHMSKLG